MRRTLGDAFAENFLLFYVVFFLLIIGTLFADSIWIAVTQ